MDFKKVLHRTNLNSLREHLLYGTESFESPSHETYSERLMEAKNKIEAFLSARFSDRSEYEEIYGYFYEQAGVFEEVYFEIGLLMGAKIGCQIQERLGELS